MKYNACSFTGHRAIEPRHIGKIDAMVARAVEYAYNEGCRKFYCGGALGFDTVAARQIIQFRLRHPDCELHLVIPCKNQSERWSKRQKEMYEYILSVSDTVSFLSEEYRDGCMRERNKKLAELSDIVIAYVNRGNSGAGQTVRLAKGLGKTVYNIYPALDSEE